MANTESNVATKKFTKFFNKYKIEDDTDQIITHTCCGPPFGKYSIPNSKLSKFYKLYANSLTDSDKQMHITEKRTEASPLVIDLDFKQDLNHTKRYYTDENIKKVIALYNMRIQKYIDIPSCKLEAFVFEKEEPNKRKGKIHDGIHIIYPYICIKSDLAHVIRDSVIRKVQKKKYFENIPHTNSLEEVFDKGVVDVTNWCLYGSRKAGSHPYILQRIYGHNLSEIKISEYENSNLPELLSVRQYRPEDTSQLKNTVDLDILEKKMISLNIKNKNNNQIKKQINDHIQKELNISNLINYASADEIETTIGLTKLLSVKRADNYYDWIRVGWCLHNIDNTLLDSWIEFSKKTSNTKQFKIGECEKLWVTFRDEGFGIGSLYHWAKIDNLDGFLEYKKQKVGQIISNSVNGTPYDIAVVLHEMYQDKFTCASLKHNLWYEFQNHRWVEIEEAYTLHYKISTEMVNEYSKLAAKLYGEVAQCEGVEKEALLRRVGMIHKVIDKLKSTKFKTDIMKECKYLFYDIKFLDRLDENRDLLCFSNGVYDLEYKHFRDGTPDDYITLCTNIDYVPYDENSKHVKEVYKYFEQVQPKKDMREYVLILLSSYLQGHTPDEKFHLWTGTGANSKSKLLELFQMAMGDYAGTLPISMLTQKRAASGTATPEMAMTKGKRFCVFQEPEENDKIRVGLMKELTGGDKIMARQLFKEPIEFKPQFKLLLTCNKLPYIPSSDGGTWRRLRVVEFGSKFVDHPKAPNEFKKDEYLALKFENWNVALMSLLIHKFAEYKDNGLVEPKKVTKFTNKYQESSDVYLEFLNESFKETGKKEDYITINAMYSIFKSWFKECYSDRKAPGKREFKDYICDKYEEFVNNNNVWGLNYICNEDNIIKNLEDNL